MNKRVVQGLRLIYCQERADNPDFWSKYWANKNPLILKKIAIEGVRHVDFWPLLMKYLSKDEEILEGGCAPGHTVIALKSQGYNIRGVDFSREAISQIKEVYSDAPVEFGDVLSLNYPDASFRAYILLGVVEHFIEGPGKILQEAHRVLHTDGKLLVSVPFFNPLRRVKAFCGALFKAANGYNVENFYQYAFRPSEFSGILEKIGFQVTKVHYYSTMKGIKDEIPLFRKLLEQKMIPSCVLKFLRTNNAVKAMASHMVLFVARKV